MNYKIYDEEVYGEIEDFVSVKTDPQNFYRYDSSEKLLDPNLVNLFLFRKIESMQIEMDDIRERLKTLETPNSISFIKGTR